MQRLKYTKFILQNTGVKIKSRPRKENKLRVSENKLRLFENKLRVFENKRCEEHLDFIET
jgi:hypothetical protein